MASTSIAPNPPTITSSSTCSASERNESSGFGCQVLREDSHAHLRVGLASSDRAPLRLDPPAHACDLVLDRVDRLARHRRLGKPPQVCRRWFGYAFGLGPYVFRMEGKRTVRRLPSTPLAPSDTSAIRRIAPRNFNGMFMIFL